MHSYERERGWRDDEYRRVRRDRDDESILERIKNDVKAWFSDEDDYEGAGYGPGTRYAGSRASRRRNRDEDYDQFRNTGSRSRSGRHVGESDYDSHDDRGRQLPVILYSEYWVTPGPYAGVGPKGYAKSPESLKERVCERLEGHGELDASDIEVSCENEEVTLAGTVKSRREKRLAEQCAEAVYGVQDVHNRLTVNRQYEGEHEGSTESRRGRTELPGQQGRGTSESAIN